MNDFKVLLWGNGAWCTFRPNGTVADKGKAWDYGEIPPKYASSDVYFAVPCRDLDLNEWAESTKEMREKITQ